MTKEIFYDLEFDELGVNALSERGRQLIRNASTNWDLTGLYRVAIYEGMHVRFSTAEVRDQITRVTTESNA